MVAAMMAAIGVIVGVEVFQVVFGQQVAAKHHQQQKGKTKVVPAVLMHKGFLPGRGDAPALHAYTNIHVFFRSKLHTAK